MKSPLRQRLEDEAAMCGVPMGRLTVLSSQRDPFRVDTPANHRDAQWLAEQVRDRLGDRTVHLRGLHYVLLGSIKPDGSQYVNNEANWTWLSEKAAQAARWLGYLAFEQIIDQRNEPPQIIEYQAPNPTPVLDLGGVQVELPEFIEDPQVYLADVRGVQPYKLVFYGEKSSLGEVLAPLARHYHADLYLPTGEISNTMMHTMAKTAAHDGRPMAVFAFSDCDPAGHQMPVSIGRKLQAMETILFPGLEWQVRQVALLPEHVLEYGLPSTPLKDTEKRAGRWIEAMGVEQTEIDALAALQPHILREIAEVAIDPFFDRHLEARVSRARQEWEERAQDRLRDIIGEEQLQQYRQQAQELLDQMQAQVQQINDGLRVDASDLDLPPFALPDPDIQKDMHGEPLVSSAWTFVDQCERLIASKEYRR